MAPAMISAAPTAISIVARALTDGWDRGMRISLRPHEREQNHVADRGLVGEQHRQGIEADALARRRRHPDLERAAVVLVVIHGLGRTGGPGAQLRLEPGALVVRIVELGEAVRDLLAVHEQLEAIAERGVAIAPA